MMHGLHVGFGSLIGGDLLAELRERGVQMVRSDYLHVQVPLDIEYLINEVLDAGLVPLAVIRPDQASWLPSAVDVGPLDVEIWNEPDIGTPPTMRMSPAEYAFEVRYARTLSGCHRLWTGVISNLDVDSLEWLKASIAAGWPEDVGVSIHRYPPNGGRPEHPQQGFGSREHEVDRLRAIIGDRPFGVSEFGYHRGEQSLRQGWFGRKRWRWTPEEQAQFTAWEFEFWRAMGAAFACAYQINSGTGPGYLDQFGWRDADGAWLPVADALRATT
jgi:hypothetical protein